MKFTIVILSAVFCLNARAAEEKSSDEALVAAAEQLIAEGQAEDKNQSEATPVVEAKKEAEPKESEIPVVMSSAKPEGAKDNGIWRLVASLGVVAVTAAIALFAAKRWGRKKDKGGQKARIELMHQLHMGPRKSIGLIRVAGETILVGITDQNINMLKAVTLIDEELEHIAHKDFNGFLEDEFSIEDVRTALTGKDFRG